MIDTVTYSGFVLSSRKITTLGIRTGVHSEHLRLQQFLGVSHLAEEVAVNEAVLYRERALASKTVLNTNLYFFLD